MARSGAILLVEDDPDDRKLAIRALTRNGIVNEIVVATTGVEALDYLFARGTYASRDPRELPAVVLLDLKLPKLDGFEVLRQIRENQLTRLQPVVILTSSRQEEDLVNGYQLGANSYVQKPVEFEAFSDAIRQLGMYWLLLNERPFRAGDKAAE